MASRLQRVSRAIRFIMIAADSNTTEEFERARRTMSEDDREFSVLIANQLIELTDALLEPIRADLDKPVKLAGADIEALRPRSGPSSGAGAI